MPDQGYLTATSHNSPNTSTKSPSLMCHEEVRTPSQQKTRLTSTSTFGFDSNFRSYAELSSCLSNDEEAETSNDKFQSF
jgi:hypothetical protein